MGQSSRTGVCYLSSRDMEFIRKASVYNLR